MIDTPEVLTTEPLTYACIALKIPIAEIRQVMGPTLEEVKAAVKAQGVDAAGPWFTHHFARPITNFDFEICVPTARATEAAGRAAPRVWGATKVARTLFHGDYSGMVGGWMELERWIKAQGLRGGEEFWERYTMNSENSPTAGDWRTELSWPLLD